MNIDIIQTDQLEKSLGEENLLILDCCPEEKFLQAHIPGAINIQPGQLQSGIKPASGSLPEEKDLQQLFSQLGISKQKKIICMDEEGGTWAGRLLWTLELFGFKQAFYLDGGRLAWLGEQRITETGPSTPEPCNFDHNLDQNKRVYAETILQELDSTNFTVWDSRSAEEYAGTKKLAEKAGHIPGAFLLEWTDLQQQDNFRRLKPLADIRALLSEKGVNENSSIVTHCQSHRRSGLTWLAGQLLGLNIRAYDGSWADWGNRDDTPVEKSMGTSATN